MQTVKVVTLKEHVYANVRRTAGDIYQADPKFLQLLLGLERVKLMEPEQSKYKRRDMRAEK